VLFDWLSPQILRQSVLSIACACAVLTSGCGGGAATGGEQSSTATLTSLTIAPATVSQPAGVSQQFTAIATFSNGKARDVTAQSKWASNDATIAAITNSGEWRLP
jgi:hypothetical protein